MLRFYTILLMVLVWGPVRLYAQEQKSLPQLADDAFARQEYAVAATLYSRLAERKGNKASLKLLGKTAQCYIEMARFTEAGYWYLQMLERPDCPAEIGLLYSEIQKNIEEYDTAKIYLGRYNGTGADSIMQWRNMMLAGCDSALLWKKDTLNLAVENIKELSSQGADWVSGMMKAGLLVVSNGYRKMALSTGAERNPATDPRVNQPFFKAYLFKQYTKGGIVNNVLEEVLPKVLGKVPYHVGPVCFNSREDTLYVTLNVWGKDMADRTKKGAVNGKRLMSLFWSVKKDSVWSPLEPVAALNLAGYFTGNATLSGDGNILYFVSDRPGGQGKTDLWYSEKQADGNWGPPANCGPVINTRFEEGFPTINEAGSLYFSSKGHPGMGGFDIFRTTGNRAEWSAPRNLHRPFNSGSDDLGFVIKSNQYEGYFSSNRRGGGGGDDIYHFMDTHISEKLENPKAGKPTQPDTAAVTPPVPTKTDSTIVNKLEKLYFLYDYNSAELLTASKDLLDRVAVVLQQHPEWKLMVRSYADSRGSDKYNIDLSALRSYAVIDYLVKKGVSAKRMYYENLGERVLVNPCGNGVPCDESQHRENRRSMLKILY
ncbi:OmpA family protein [Chitinophaga sp. GbtcB8]|uniref:OmpA family protein n=1 Tax=Chitinophaga sp. GbtcB8 TaxID=2824753 RepID=UPI001C310290|nr:OmpA family protein [Chitinophaga sp. GbtcB8]